MLSFAYYPDVPVSPCLSDPARSTNCNLLTVTLSKCLISCDSTVKQKIVCDLEETSFKLCEAKILFFEPNLKSSTASSAELHSKTYKFSTTN